MIDPTATGGQAGVRLRMERAEAGAQELFTLATTMGSGAEQRRLKGLRSEFMEFVSGQAEGRLSEREVTILANNMTILMLQRLNEMKQQHLKSVEESN